MEFFGGRGNFFSINWFTPTRIRKTPIRRTTGHDMDKKKSIAISERRLNDYAEEELHKNLEV